ncbi:hypothetical protein [Pantoea ananatis]|uniref:hypothetical protein n=1 Tax=Pantoea ananas TaxID=553 RepID=UPI0023627C66|nr:hypothetical protein [Pantoea ananatis]
MHYFASSLCTFVFVEPFSYTVILKYQQPLVMNMHDSLIAFSSHYDKPLTGMILIKGRFA